MYVRRPYYLLISDYAEWAKSITDEQAVMPYIPAELVILVMCLLPLCIIPTIVINLPDVVFWYRGFLLVRYELRYVRHSSVYHQV